MKDITIKFDTAAEKQLRKLSPNILTKLHRQLNFLITNRNHPSLRVKKKQGENIFEARVDYHYRFTFIVEEKTLWILSIGPHDEGLGKK